MAHKFRYDEADSFLLSVDCTADFFGRLHWRGPGAQAFFGYSDAELDGMPIEKLLPQPMQEAHVKLAAAFAQSGHSRKVFGASRSAVERKNGDAELVDLHMKPFFTMRPFKPIVMALVERRRHAQPHLIVMDMLGTVVAASATLRQSFAPAPGDNPARPKRRSAFGYCPDLLEFFTKFSPCFQQKFGIPVVASEHILGDICIRDSSPSSPTNKSRLMLQQDIEYNNIMKSPEGNKRARRSSIITNPNKHYLVRANVGGATEIIFDTNWCVFPTGAIYRIANADERFFECEGSIYEAKHAFEDLEDIQQKMIPVKVRMTTTNIGFFYLELAAEDPQLTGPESRTSVTKYCDPFALPSYVSEQLSQEFDGPNASPGSYDQINSLHEEENRNFLPRQNLDSPDLYEGNYVNDDQNSPLSSSAILSKRHSSSPSNFYRELKMQESKENPSSNSKSNSHSDSNSNSNSDVSVSKETNKNANADYSVRINIDQYVDENSNEINLPNKLRKVNHTRFSFIQTKNNFTAPKTLGRPSPPPLEQKQEIVDRNTVDLHGHVVDVFLVRTQSPRYLRFFHNQLKLSIFTLIISTIVFISIFFIVKHVS